MVERFDPPAYGGFYEAPCAPTTHEAELALLVPAPGEDAAVLGHGECVAAERAAVHALHVHVLEERQTNVNR